MRLPCLRSYVISYEIPPLNYKYTDILLKKQELASSKNIGIWDNDAKEKYSNKEDINEYENTEIVIITVGFIIIVMILKLIGKK